MPRDDLADAIEPVPAPVPLPNAQSLAVARGNPEHGVVRAEQGTGGTGAMMLSLQGIDNPLEVAFAFARGLVSGGAETLNINMPGAKSTRQTQPTTGRSTTPKPEAPSTPMLLMACKNC